MSDYYRLRQSSVFVQKEHVGEVRGLLAGSNMWDLGVDENGDGRDLDFNGDVTGYEEAILEAITPYVGAGSFVELQEVGGNSLFRLVFTAKGEIKTLHPEIIWNMGELE